MKYPDRVTAIITQNGNANLEGFSQDWAPWETYWREPTPTHREAVCASLSDQAIRFQREHGAPAGAVSPDDYVLDTFYMHRPGAEEIQLDLILSYRTNVALYPAFQSYLRTYCPLCWRCGACMMPSFFRPERRRTGGTCPMRKSIFSIRVISRWKPTIAKSQHISGTSLGASSAVVR
jgi:hypothetical protein